MSYKIIISVISIVLLVFVGALALIAIENSTPKVTPENSMVDNQQLPQTSQPTCFTGGCSGEICSDRQDMVSICIYKEEFACYKTAQCARQATGQCGWTQTVELTSCLMGK